MILREVLKNVRVKDLSGSDNLEIAGISYNSNKANDNFIFIALRGEKTDGHKYIDQALKNGAKALIVENSLSNNYEDVSVVEVDNTRAALSHISVNFYNDPTAELTLAGITGTNGKTTITYLLESIWEAGGLRPGVIGTVDYRYGGSVIQSTMTTPESLELMKYFREMRQSGVDTVAMEVSSHALDRSRVKGCHFDAAVFTNLTQDHLDYHGDFKTYLAAKKKLFTESLRESEKKNKFSIINIDDNYGPEVYRAAPFEKLTYSIQDSAALVYARSSSITNEGISARVETPWGPLDIHSKLVGEHNLSNILGALTTALSLGSSVESVEKGISLIPAVPGRLEAIDNPFNFKVLVDYAHTPDALKNVLMAVKPITEGNVILVFGCGGDRDRTKRPQMGKIGRELSDILIVTSDNPRTESPEFIIDEIEEGVSGAGAKQNHYHRIADRTDAINEAIKIAKPNDTVIIAGKGHEDYQIIGTTKYPYDDRKVARDALSARTG